MGKQKEMILKGLSPNQREAAESTDRDVLVRAGAGSGKTKTLVARYLLLLDENRAWSPADITAVTFTRKAAREMQSRIRTEMMNLARLSDTDSAEKQYWLERLNEMDSANIGTIHSLCARILRAHPAEAGLDPAFSVLEDNNAAILTAQIVEETISRISADRTYEQLLSFYDGNRLTKLLTAMLKNRGKTDEMMAVSGEKTADYLKKKLAETLPQPKYSDIIAEYREDAAEPDFDKRAGNLAGNIRRLVKAYDEALELLQTDAHPADAAAHIYSPFTGWDFRQGSKQMKAGAMRFRDELTADFPFLKDDKGRDIRWYKEFWEQYDAAEGILRMLWPTLRNEYMRMLDAAQTIDFEAMENLTLELLRKHPELRSEWTSRVKALLVDEFQDTNDAQAELFTMLDPSHDRLFAVGDKKQSIYGFRGTNVALFDRRGAEAAEYEGRDILLDTTYRTEPELLTPMGGLLEKVMADAELGGKDYYAAYEPMKTPDGLHEKPDPLPKAQPAVELLLGDVQQKADDPDGEWAGRMLAQRLTELMETGLMHSWNDAAILCRNSNDFKQFENALETWHIPYVTVAGKGYYDRPEIRDMLNILRAAENPHDNAALTGFLLSPFIGFTLEMAALLYRYANKGGVKMSFYRALTDEGFSYDTEVKQKKLEKARFVLDSLIRLSGQVPLDEVLEEAYRLTGIRTMLALDSGDRAWLNLDKLLTTARESGLVSVSEFLEYLENIKETGAREGEAPSDNNGAVRIMTIHQAKGLEFRVTVIAENESRAHYPQFAADPAGAPVFYSSPAVPQYTDAQKLANDRDKAEWLRLFYVAATRAEYRLIICGSKPAAGGTKDSWLRRLTADLSDEMLQSGNHVGPAWGIGGETVMVRCCSELPEAPEFSAVGAAPELTVSTDCSLIDPLPVRPEIPRSPEHTAALTVGKLVHKGIELWRFPDENGSDPVLQEAFRKILMQTESLDAGEQRAVLEKAEMLLSRFRKSDAFTFLESAEERRHEIPFSFMKRNFTVNGVIDLLLKDSSGGYTIIDFKTDALKDLTDLSEAVDEHSRQLENYRQAVKTTLGEDSRCLICFLDFCGEVILQPAGKDMAMQPEAEDADEWLPEEPAWDDYFFEENSGYSDMFIPEI